MTLDREEDRQILLQLIQNATVPGGAVLIVADLIHRIKTAAVDGSKQVQDRTPLPGDR